VNRCQDERLDVRRGAVIDSGDSDAPAAVAGLLSRHDDQCLAVQMPSVTEPW
jgi:hypothetical protein